MSFGVAVMNISHSRFSMLRGFSRAQRVLLCGVLLGAASPFVAAPARADEFSTVAANDPLYRAMSVVARSGWMSASATASPNGAAALSTRYEMALQTSEAIYTISARHNADPSWDATVSATSLRALRDLTNGLRPELQKLGVDSGAALRLMNRLLARPNVVAPNVVSPNLSSVANVDVSTSSTGLLNARLGAQASSSLSLARRFRIDSAVSALESEARDPLGNGVSTRVQGAGLAFDVTRGLSLRAGYAQRDLTNDAGLNRLGLQTRIGQNQERGFNGGVDLSLRNGLLFSTQIEKLSGQNGGMRLSGGVGLSAWQNRLSLVAKLSRLTPEDVNAMSPSTMANLNLGYDVSRNISLNLLYQRLFSAPTPGRSGVLAGGVSIKF